MEWLRQGFSLHAAAACEYNGFAAESRESHCNGSVRRVNGESKGMRENLPVLKFLTSLSTSISEISTFQWSKHVEALL